MHREMQRFPPPLHLQVTLEQVRRVKRDCLPFDRPPTILWNKLQRTKRVVISMWECGVCTQTLKVHVSLALQFMPSHESLPSYAPCQIRDEAAQQSGTQVDERVSRPSSRSRVLPGMNPDQPRGTCKTSCMGIIAAKSVHRECLSTLCGHGGIFTADNNMSIVDEVSRDAGRLRVKGEVLLRATC